MEIPHKEHPAEVILEKCNALLWNCKAESCDHHYENATDIECPVCGEIRRRCKGSPIKGGNGRCLYHNGKAPVGIAHSGYRGRGRSKNLPSRMMEQYELSLNDPDILDMTPNISLLEARREDLISRVDKEAAFLTWGKLKDAYARFSKARRSGNKQGAAEIMAESLSDMEDLIIRGNQEAAIWHEVLDIEERVRKMKLAEIRRRTLSDAIITEVQFRTLLGFVIQSVQTRVRNNDEKMLVLSDIASLKL